MSNQYRKKPVVIEAFQMTKERRMDNSEWQGVRRRVLPALPGKNFNTLTHGLVAGVAARFARHDVVLVVNVANAGHTIPAEQPAEVGRILATFLG